MKARDKFSESYVIIWGKRSYYYHKGKVNFELSYVKRELKNGISVLYDSHMKLQSLS